MRLFFMSRDFFKMWYKLWLTNKEEQKKNNNKQMRRQTSECLKGSHLPLQIYTIHVFWWDFVIFKNYLRLYFMQNTQVLGSLKSTSKSLETLNVYTDRLWPWRICTYIIVLMLCECCVLITKKKNVVLYIVIYLLV